ncbi:MAG: HEPN domain-containing protein [Planctomycetota bacterium]
MAPGGRGCGIAELIESVAGEDPEMKRLQDLKADTLTVYATEVRYPDDFYTPSIPETRECIAIAEAARAFIRSKLQAGGFLPNR